MRILLMYSYLIFSLLGPSDSPSVVTEPGDSQLTVLGVLVGADTLKTVQEKLGAAKPCVSEHVTMLAYNLGKETVLFESSDVGGGDITGLALRPSETRPVCNPSSPRTGLVSLRTDGGVHLGMPRDEFTKMFGSPKRKKQNGTWFYQWLRTENLTKSQKQGVAQSFPGLETTGSVDILTTVKARFSAKGLTYFYISRIKSL